MQRLSISMVVCMLMLTLGSTTTTLVKSENDERDIEISDEEFKGYLQTFVANEDDGVGNDGSLIDFSGLGLVYEASKAANEEAIVGRDLKKACAPGCAAEMIGDGSCDAVCHVKACKNDGGDCDGFNIDVGFITNNINASVFNAVKYSAERWGKILGDVPGIAKISNGTNCNGIVFNGDVLVDDMLILIGLIPIDGPKGILGGAGYCGFTRGPKKRIFPVLYMIILDIDDIPLLEQGDFLGDVMLHEMGHAVGVGSSWEYYKLLQGANPLVYKGKGGIKGLKMVKGKGKPIVEEEGGNGTARAHWDEETYQDELMTGYLNGVHGKLSKMTINSLTDIGYKVNLKYADPYTVPTPALRGVEAEEENNEDKGLKLEGCIQKTKNPPVEFEYIPPQ